MEDAPISILNTLATFKNVEALEQARKIYANDEEVKKIRKQKKQKKASEVNQDAVKNILNEIQQLLNETKQNHKEAFKQSKKYLEFQNERERKMKENEKLKMQLKVLTKLQADLELKLQGKQEEYNKIAGDESKLKQDLVASFQDEIKQIQENVEAKCQQRAVNQRENEHLKQKIHEAKELIQKRENIFSTELEKHDLEKQQREQKIEEQLNSLAKNMGVGDNFEDKLLEKQAEEELVDKHLEPYLTRSQEFSKIVEQTNQQFEPYKKEMKRLQMERQMYEDEYYKYVAKTEKNDLYVADMVEQYLQLNGDLQNQMNSIQSLQTLKSSLLAKLAPQ